ncbi:MAG: transporter substrate-binding domain-containing protein [Rickettsiales bacterium]|nr:MAG: transporter substrate-binding domain-containing protein [Rickettsiales bacterium]
MKYIKLLIITILALSLSGCFDNKDENTWIVGTSADNPPYEYMKNGKIVGFDIDLMIAIGQHLGKNIEFKNMDFHGLLAAVSTKNVDFVVAGMSITKERLARVDFSIPYCDARIALLVRAKDEITKPSDLKGKVVGSQLGTIWSLINHDMGIHHGFQPKTLANNLILVEELKSGRIDAVILEEAQAKKFVSKNPQFQSFHVEQYSSSFAIAMPKNSINKKNIDHTIKTLQKNGVINDLAKKWGIAHAN